jgi:hypothetical protein
MGQNLGELRRDHGQDLAEVAGHPAGQPASAFPDVNLTDAAAEHPSAQPGPGHGSASWWEKTQAGPARHAAPGDPR